MDCKSILNEVREMYTSCQAYTDAGSSLLKNTKQAAVRRVTTDFRRPDGFKFECGSEGVKATHPIISIRWNGEKTIANLPHLATDRVEELDIETALRAANSLSFGTACLVPPLLLNYRSENEHELFRLEQLDRGTDQQCSGVYCYFITGMIAESSIRVWIDKSDFVIRRIVKHQQISTEQQVARMVDGLVNLGHRRNSRLVALVAKMDFEGEICEVDTAYDLVELS